MSIKIEPLSFLEEEQGLNINTDILPGAVEKTQEKKETEVKPKADEKPLKEDKASAVENNDNTPFDFLSDTDKEDGDEEQGDNKSVNTSGDKKEITQEDIDYKGLTEFLISQEIFKDFEGKEEFNYTPDNFKFLLQKQVENAVNERLTEEKSQYGSSANQLIDFLKSGGTVEQFASNYSQQVDIEAIDISDEDGQENIAKTYYESLGWKPEKIKKQIERLKDDGELAEEAKEYKAKLVESIEEDRKAMIAEQEAIAEDRKIRASKFNTQVRESIHGDSNLADRDKKALDKFAFEYKYQDNNGNKYSEFAIKFNEIQKDPQKYAKFLKFVKNFEDFEEKKVVKKETEKEMFNFFKKGSNPLEGASSAQPIKNKVSNSPPGIKFK